MKMIILNKNKKIQTTSGRRVEIPLYSLLWYFIIRSLEVPQLHLSHISA
ncbi:MAG: hypothetical protein J7L95_07010 [Prolixibacteraceae bacterium]|nr:hypothetical protein [Prolixibacteraceae bacterium]